MTATMPGEIVAEDALHAGDPAYPRLCTACRARPAAAGTRACEHCATPTTVSGPVPAPYEPARHELEPVYAQLVAEIGPPGLMRYPGQVVTGEVIRIEDNP